MASQVSHLEPWLTLAELAEHLKVSPRWLKYRIKEGMPSSIIAGRRKFKASTCEDWLEKEGHMSENAA